LIAQPKSRVLILACGNTLRSDDGVGPWLAGWAEQHFASHPEIRIISRQQWTPDIAEDIAHSDSVLFVDCSVSSAPGYVRLIRVEPSVQTEGLATHHQGASQLLALTRDLYNSQPAKAALLTIGVGSTDLGETFSEPALRAIPFACALLECTIVEWSQ
jgi:hydrogenase maturation protease